MHILDQPAAALIRDLKDSLSMCIWSSGVQIRQDADLSKEQADATTTRRIHRLACWYRGNAPFTYGATDQFGWKAEKDVLSLHDFHATILHLLGLDHERLSYYHNGIERRLTDVHGHVVSDLIA